MEIIPASGSVLDGRQQWLVTSCYLATEVASSVRDAERQLDPRIVPTRQSLWAVGERGMLKHCVVLVLALALSLSFLAQTARAFIDPPYLAPEHPAPGEIVSVKIRAGECDSIGTIADYPRITQTGNAIRIVLWSTTDTDPILCNTPIGTGTYAVGGYPAGSYTLQVDRDYFGAAGELLTETLGVLAFTVTGGTVPPVSAPTLTGFGLWMLVVSVLGLAAYRLRSRQLLLVVIAALLLPSHARSNSATKPSDRSVADNSTRRAHREAAGGLLRTPQRRATLVCTGRDKSR